MAWTYYTAPLTAGQELTSAMWYELCEALAERLAVGGGAYQVDLTAAATIRDSGIHCRRVPIRESGGAVQMLSWCENIFTDGMIGRWADGTTGTAALTTSAYGMVVAANWTAEGLDEAGFGELSTAVDSYYTTTEGWNDRRFWNIVRSTIQRLKVMIPEPWWMSFSSTFRGGNRWAPPDTWADVVSDYTASDYAGGVVGLASQVYATNYLSSAQLGLTGYKSAATVVLPSASALSSANVWVFLTNYYSGPSDTVAVSIGAASASATVGSLATTKLVLGTGLDVRGSQSMTMKLAGYDSPSAYEPTTDGQHLAWNVAVDGAVVFIQPTFTKP